VSLVDAEDAHLLGEELQLFQRAADIGVAGMAL